MLTRQKIIDLRLEEEKFYFPGETIKGMFITYLLDKLLKKKKTFLLRCCFGQSQKPNQSEFDSVEIHRACIYSFEREGNNNTI